LNARTLFGIAAAFNFLVGLLMLVAYPLVSRVLGLEGPPTVWFHIAAAIVIIFGYAYWRIAQDPVTYRPFVALGAIAKLAFVIAIYGHWLVGTGRTAKARLGTADLIFAVLFVAYFKVSGMPASV
jgi:hypothetical protein